MNAWDFGTYWITRLDWMVLFGAVLIVGAIVIFWKMARGRGRFDFAQKFEGEDGRTSMAKFLAFIGGLTSTWVVVSLAAARELSEGMFAIYLITLVTGKVASEYVAANKAKDKQVPAADQPTDASMDMKLMVNTSPGATAARANGPRRPLGKP
jgi:hypothetical protein